MSGAFPHLFSKHQIGPVGVKNRIVMLPLGTALASDTGAATREFIDYYTERARGGAGLIIVEATLVDHPVGRIGPTQITIDDDRYIAGLNELTESVHDHGAKLFVQLHHGGRQTTPQLTQGQCPVAPSAIGCKMCGSSPKEMSASQIAGTVEKFICAAERAKRAGFDGVELHGAHGYLINQFMSPHTNHRTDEFGGSLDNRMRFPLLIVEGIRSALGDFPISFRVSVDEMIPGGITLDEGVVMARIMSDAGVDVLNITSGIYESMASFIEPCSKPQAWRAYLAAAVKQAVNTPVITAGVIREPEAAERLLETGVADFVGIGRGLVADPEWPTKARLGRADEIRKCLSCNTCFSRISNGLHIRCAVNARVGREGHPQARTACPARVMVIGAGPAGMEAARVAKLKGHDVAIFEKRERLGGQLNIAMTPPGKQKIAWLLSLLSEQLRRLGVTVVTGMEVKPEDVHDYSPDTVVIATGSRPFVPQIPGIDFPTVSNAWDVLQGKANIGAEHVVVAGGGMVGCETALYLAQKSCAVTVVDMLPIVAQDVEPISRGVLIDELTRADVHFMTGRTMLEILPGSVRMASSSGHVQSLECDRVVLALGACPSISQEQLRRIHAPHVYVIGDSRKPGRIIDAIGDGYRIGQMI